MKNFYIVVSIEQNNKRHAYVIKASESDNLLHKLKVKGIEHANICETKKKADEISNIWNEEYRNNGTYAFS